MHWFRLSKHQTTQPPQTTIKQARFYKSGIYDKQLGFNKPAVVIRDCLFAVFRHLCFNGCLCDMRHIRSRSGFGTNHTANRRRSSINKRLSNIIVFTIRQRKIIRPQTTRIKHYLHFTPFSHPKSQQSFLCQQTIIRPSYYNRLRLRKDNQKHNRPQKTPYYPQVENFIVLPTYLFSLKNTTTRLLKRQRRWSIQVGHFPRRVSMVIFLQSKIICAPTITPLPFAP